MFIGRVSRGFDFLGYLLTPARLEVAPRAVERCVERVSRLYEPGADLVRIGAYVRCWQRWARSGLQDVTLGPDSESPRQCVFPCRKRTPVDRRLRTRNQRAPTWLAHPLS